jgi:enoyl-[acyl-carrier protein] reductase I
MSKAAKPLLSKAGGCVLTLTYQGSDRVMPYYNVMGPAKASLEASVKYLAASLGTYGVRVNAISAGPIRTLAASGIQGFRKMLDLNAQTAALGENVSIEQVGNAALFLCSPWASGITGEVLFVDGGFNIMGMNSRALQSE